MRFWVVLLGLVWAGMAHAASVESVTVEHADGRYRIAMTVQVGVAAASAYRVMTDFEALPEVNNNVLIAKRLPNEHLHTVVEMCVAFFCRQVNQVQHYETEPPGVLRMLVVPERSDLRFGMAQWRFQPLNQNTSLLHFDAQLEPDFWVPPLIGPWLVQRKLQQQALITSNGIERVARERH